MPFEIEVKKHVFAKAHFYIDENLIRYDGKEIYLRDISGFGYMQTQTRVNGIKTSKTFDINLWKGGDKRPAMVIRFSGAVDGGAANDMYVTLTDQIWNYLGDRMLQELHDDLLKGKVYVIDGNIKLISTGMVVRRKPLFKPAYELLIEWRNARVSTFQATLSIKSIENRKAKLYGLFARKNIWLLYYYVNWLTKSPDAMQALMAAGNNYQLIPKS